MTDKELASTLGISLRTLYRVLARPKGWERGNRLDLRGLAPFIVGGVRRWRVREVAAAMGVTPEEINGRL